MHYDKEQLTSCFFVHKKRKKGVVWKGKEFLLNLQEMNADNKTLYSLAKSLW